jgi:hypothetical protein|tara:strand:- start:2513 stop:2704 length:192 start_codon:yes stop_codon:yes gene_type:complete
MSMAAYIIDELYLAKAMEYQEDSDFLMDAVEILIDQLHHLVNEGQIDDAIVVSERIRELQEMQ